MEYHCFEGQRCSPSRSDRLILYGPLTQADAILGTTLVTAAFVAFVVLMVLAQMAVRLRVRQALSLVEDCSGVRWSATYGLGR